MLASRAVVAAGAVGGGAAPDALVAAGAVAVLLRGRMVTARAVARRAAVFAMLLVVAMLVFAGRAVVAAASVAHASTVSAFRAHDAFLSLALVYHNLSECGGKMSAAQFAKCKRIRSISCSVRRVITFNAASIY